MEERRKTPLEERQEFMTRFLSALKSKYGIHPHQVLAIQDKLNTYRVHVSKYTLRKWLACEVSPEITQIKGIAAMLGTTPEYLAFGRCADDEADAIAMYRALPDYAKAAVIGMLRKLHKEAET